MDQRQLTTNLALAVVLFPLCTLLTATFPAHAKTAPPTQVAVSAIEPLATVLGATIESDGTTFDASGQQTFPRMLAKQKYCHPKNGFC